MRTKGSAGCLQLVREMFARCGWKLEADPEDGTIFSAFAVPGGGCGMVFRDFTDHGVFVAHFLPLPARLKATGSAALAIPHDDDDRERAVNALLAELNRSLIVGRWEWGPEMGEIRFTIALPYCDNPPSPQQLHHVLRTGLDAVGAQMQALADLAYDGDETAAAFTV